MGVVGKMIVIPLLPCAHMGVVGNTIVIPLLPCAHMGVVGNMIVIPLLPCAHMGVVGKMIVTHLYNCSPVTKAQGKDTTAILYRGVLKIVSLVHVPLFPFDDEGMHGDA